MISSKFNIKLMLRNISKFGIQRRCELKSFLLCQRFQRCNKSNPIPWIEHHSGYTQSSTWNTFVFSVGKCTSLRNIHHYQLLQFDQLLHSPSSNIKLAKTNTSRTRCWLQPSLYRIQTEFFFRWNNQNCPKQLQ